MYQTALSLPTSLAQGVLISIPEICYFGTGFVAGTNAVDDDQIISRFLWNDTTLWLMRTFSSLGLAVIALMSYLLIRRYTLRDEIVRTIEEAVKARLDADSVDDLREHYSDDLVDADASISDNNYQKDKNQNTSAIAFDDEEMLMMNFSSSEVRFLVSKGENGVRDLKLKILVGLFLAVITLIALVLAISFQLQTFSQTYIVLFMTLILLVSLYILYDSLRYCAIIKVNSFEPDRQVILLNKALDFNVKQKEHFKRNFDSIYTPEVENVFIRQATRQSNAAAKEEIRKLGDPPKDEGDVLTYLPGYKRIYVGLLSCTILGFLGCTVLIGKAINPVDHGPTLNPTLSPSGM